MYEDNPFESFERLTVYEVKGRASVAWKKVAEELEPDDTLVQKYTSMSKDTFGVRIAKEDE
jgi:hypothetical protein